MLVLNTTVFELLEKLETTVEQVFFNGELDIAQFLENNIIVERDQTKVSTCGRNAKIGLVEMIDQRLQLVKPDSSWIGHQCYSKLFLEPK